MLYGFGVFAETLADNAFGNYRRQRQLERSLNQLRDHFILCGYGRIGTEIVAEFEDHKIPYAVIDQTGSRRPPSRSRAACTSKATRPARSCSSRRASSAREV